MSNESSVEAVVMRRVHTVHRFRPLVSGGTVALAVFVFALWGIGREVWVAQVFANAPTDLIGFVKFFIAAFENTRTTVQALSIAAFFGMLWFFRDLFKVVSYNFVSSKV